MKLITDGLAKVINGHFDGVFKDEDITIFIHKDECKKLTKSIHLSNYDFFAVDEKECEFYFISSICGKSKQLFVEGALNEQGMIIHNETDILITPRFLLKEVHSQLSNGVYSRRLTMMDDFTFEDLTGLR